MLLAFITVSILDFCNLDNYVKRKTYQYQICPYGKKPYFIYLPIAGERTNGPSKSYRIGRRLNKWLSNTLYQVLVESCAARRSTTPQAASGTPRGARAPRGTHAGATRNAAHAASAIEQLLSLARGSLRRALPTVPCPSRARRRQTEHQQTPNTLHCCSITELSEEHRTKERSTKAKRGEGGEPRLDETLQVLGQSKQLA